MMCAGYRNGGKDSCQVTNSHSFTFSEMMSLFLKYCKCLNFREIPAVLWCCNKTDDGNWLASYRPVIHAPKTDSRAFTIECPTQRIGYRTSPSLKKKQNKIEIPPVDQGNVVYNIGYLGHFLMKKKNKILQGARCVQMSPSLVSTTSHQLLFWKNSPILFLILFFIFAFIKKFTSSLVSLVDRKQTNWRVRWLAL